MGGGTRASERANSNDGNDGTENTENTDNTDNTKNTENAENTSSSSARTWRNMKAIQPTVSATATRMMKRKTTTHAMVTKTTPLRSRSLNSLSKRATSRSHAWERRSWLRAWAGPTQVRRKRSAHSLYRFRNLPLDGIGWLASRSMTRSHSSSTRSHTLADASSFLSRVAARALAMRASRALRGSETSAPNLFSMNWVSMPSASRAAADWILSTSPGRATARSSDVSNSPPSRSTRSLLK